MSDICGRRRLAKLAFVTGTSGNLRGFLEEPVHATYNYRLTDPFAFHAAFLEGEERDDHDDPPSVSTPKATGISRPAQKAALRAKAASVQAREVQKTFEKLEKNGEEFKDKKTRENRNVKIAEKAAQHRWDTLRDETNVGRKTLEDAAAELKQEKVSGGTLEDLRRAEKKKETAEAAVRKIQEDMNRTYQELRALQKAKTKAERDENHAEARLPKIRERLAAAKKAAKEAQEAAEKAAEAAEKEAEAAANSPEEAQAAADQAEREADKAEAAAKKAEDARKPHHP